MSYGPNDNVRSSESVESVPASLISDLSAQYFGDKSADRALALQCMVMLMEFGNKVLKIQQDEAEARRLERADIARNERRERGFSF